MSAPRAWDRAAALPAPASGRPRAELVALRDELPSVAELFTFMRDAELRFDRLRMRIREHAWTARGEEVTDHEVTIEHPGRARIQTVLPSDDGGASYEVWLSDGETVQTYVSARRLGTRRPVRHDVRGLDSPGLPGSSRVYVPLTPLQMESLPDLFVHPAGYCQNVLATGACRIAGTASVAGREAVVLECAHPRTVEHVADRPDFAIRVAVDRLDGVILRLEESVAGHVTRDAYVTDYEPDVPLPPSALAFTYPADTVFIY